MVEIGHPNAGYVGAEWNASQLTREMLEEYVFRMEILQDDSNNGMSLLLFSDEVTGNYLENVWNYGHGAIYPEGTLAPSYELPWTPNKFYTPMPSVPEPSSFLLALIGSSLLMLKRKVKV